jgi:hypothetical protein
MKTIFVALFDREGPGGDASRDVRHRCRVGVGDAPLVRPDLVSPDGGPEEGSAGVNLIKLSSL